MKVTISVEVASQKEANDVVAKLFGAANTGASVPQLPNLNTPGNPTAGNDDEESGTAGAEGQVDKDGLPWDERIHSSSKKINANGKWARRKNVSDEAFNQVAAELRGRYTGPMPTPPAQPLPPAQPQYPAPAAPQAPQQHFQPQPPVNPQYADIPAFIANMPQQPAPAAPQPVLNIPQQIAVPQAPAPQPAAPAPSAPGTTVTDLFNKVQQIFATDPNAIAYVNSLTQRLSHQFQVQVNSINDIAPRPDMIAFAFQLLAADGK